MRKQTLIVLFAALALSPVARVSAQWVVHDPGNLAQAITSYAQHLANADNTFNTLLESRKIFEQGREYYDALKSVHSLIRNARKVEESVALSVRVVDEYGRTLSRLEGTGHFTARQLEAYNRQQRNLMLGMASVIDDITSVITVTGMSLSDKERLDLLDTSHARIVSLYNRSLGLNMQMEGEYDSARERRERKRLERELLR